MKKVFLKSLLLLCALIVGSSSAWAESKPWSCDDPSTTLDLSEITSSTMGTWNAAKSWYLDSDYLIVSGYESMKSVANQTWITHKSVGNSSTTWSASTPFKGSSYYTNANYATLQSGRALVYRVTNLKSLKVYGKNNSTSNYLDIFIYTKSGENNYTKVEEITYTTDANNHIWENSTTLSPANTYYIYITGKGGSNSRVFEVAFERNTITKHTLHMAVSPDGKGTVTPNSDTEIGEQKTQAITATPIAGYHFDNWTVDGTGSSVADASESSTTFTMGTEDATVIANFAENAKHTLSSNVDPSDAAGIVTLGATSIAEGASTTISAEANAGYEFLEWEVSGEGASLGDKDAASTTLTMGSANATVTAKFNAVITHKIQWSVNGTIIKTENIKDGNAITFAAPASGIPVGMVYKGWVTSENKIDTPTDTDPSANYVTSASSSTDITYYCVMAIETGEEGTATLTASHTTAATTYANHTYTDDKGNTWYAYCSEQTDNSCIRYGLKSQASPAVYLESPTFVGKVTEIKIQIYNGSSSNRTYYINSACGKTGDYGIVEGTKNTKLTAVKTASLVEGKVFNKFFLQTSDALGVGYISVSYSSIETFHYCTSVPDIAVTPSAEIGKHYATFFAPYNAKLDAGIAAYIGTYAANTLTLHVLENSETGTVIPANTPVVLKSTSEVAFNVVATADEESEVHDGTLLTANNLHGTLAATEAPANAYVLGYNSAAGQETGFYQFSGTIPANRAYLIISGGAAQAAGIRIVEGENNATSMENIEANHEVVKFVENGQLLIKRDGITYDALGRRIR